MSLADGHGEDDAEFVPLADYVAPEGPATDLLERLWSRAKRLVAREEDDRVVVDDRLRRPSRAALGDLTAFPDCRLLGQELDRTLEGWLAADPADGAAPDHLRLIVTPSCDVRGLLETWARRHALESLEPPSRGALLRRGELPAPSLEGEGVLVVPRLEEWFLRHRHGLGAVRGLLASLATGERRCLIGCNSWAWRFLRRVADADLLLPEPLTFAPFDAERLRRWFAELAEAEGTRAVRFREAGAGTDVFSRDADDAFESDYLETLAARAGGVPWVAWSLWRLSLRTVDEIDEKPERDEAAEASAAAGERREARDGPDAEAADVDELWLVRPGEPELPFGHERTARLVLHALLLHGPLDGETLAEVLPLVGESNVVPALERSGFVERDGTRYRCAPAAYVTVLESLQTAGFSTPEI